MDPATTSARLGHHVDVGLTGRRRQVLADYVALYNRPPGSGEQLRRLLSDDVRFVDPFNDLRGRDAVHAMLTDFAARVRAPRFDVLYQGWDGDVCLLRWWMRGEVAIIGDWRVAGVSELHFDADDRICLHIDHWDAAGQLYQRLPLIGAVLRWLRRRVAGH